MGVNQIRYKSTSSKNIQPETVAVNQTLSKEEEIKMIFLKDSTYSLVKKLFIYKMMSSNLFINYSLSAMQVLYKLAGVKMTNLLVNKTAGEVFTSGETI